MPTVKAEALCSSIPTFRSAMLIVVAIERTYPRSKDENDVQVRQIVQRSREVSRLRKNKAESAGLL
jgi:hypothetical protein